MSETPSDYIRSHDLRRKYGIGVVLLALFALGSAINGGGAALVTLKIMAALPFAVAWVCLPQIYNPERSRTPFTPSFIERTALEGILIGAGIAIVNWSADSNPALIVLGALLAAVVYFAIWSIVYRGISRRRS